MNRLLAASLAAVALVVSGCKNDFSPQSDLLGLRVMALVADRPELAPGQTITLTPWIYVPGAPTSTVQRWTFCPASAGAVSAYACAIPACEVDLPAASSGVVTANPTELLRQCGGGTIPPGIPEPLTTLFRYRVTTVTDGVTDFREAVLQVPQWNQGSPPNPNLPPVITDVLVGGVSVRGGGAIPQLAPGGILAFELQIDPASVQTYVDGAGLTQTETMTGYFYTTGGTFSAGVTTGADTFTNLEGSGVVAGQAPIQVWVVALDLRGGEAVLGPITVPIGP
jgi:hypothetical protein